MSQPSRPRSRGKAQRVSREVKFDRPVPLEQRSLMAPIVATFPLSATFTAAAAPTNSDLGTVTVTLNTTTTSIGTMAPITSVSELTSLASFGNDIVTIAAGPGGVFGNDVYAISRGAGDNNGAGRTSSGHQPPGRDLSRRSGHRSVQRLFRPQLGDQPDRSRQSHPQLPASNGLLTSIGPGQLVQHHVRFRGDLQRHAGDVRQQREPIGPQQEHHLRDRAQRDADGASSPR